MQTVRKYTPSPSTKKTEYRQTQMFQAGEDLPLLSGTAQRVTVEPFVIPQPKSAGPQLPLFDDDQNEDDQIRGEYKFIDCELKMSEPGSFRRAHREVMS